MKCSVCAARCDTFIDFDQDLPLRWRGTRKVVPCREPVYKGGVVVKYVTVGYSAPDKVERVYCSASCSLRDHENGI